MKYIRAESKVAKAINALIELKEDYNEEVIKAEIAYDLEIAIDTLNRLSTALISRD